MRVPFTSNGLAPRAVARIPLAAVMMLLLVLCLSLWSWRASHAQYQREANAGFDTQRDEVLEAIENRMHAYTRTS
jgi:hypothetical protein